MSAALTLRGAKQDVDGAGAMHLVLLGDDDGEGRAGAPHVLQSLRQGHLRVQEDEVHHHAQVPHLPAHRLGILPTVGLQTERRTDGQTHTQTHRGYMKRLRSVEW